MDGLLIRQNVLGMPFKHLPPRDSRVVKNASSRVRRAGEHSLLPNILTAALASYSRPLNLTLLIEQWAVE